MRTDLGTTTDTRACADPPPRIDPETAACRMSRQDSSYKVILGQVCLKWFHTVIAFNGQAGRAKPARFCIWRLSSLHLRVLYLFV